jgi:hypothetical protein
VRHGPGLEDVGQSSSLPLGLRRALFFSGLVGRVRNFFDGPLLLNSRQRTFIQLRASIFVEAAWFWVLGLTGGTIGVLVPAFVGSSIGLGVGLRGMAVARPEAAAATAASVTVSTTAGVVRRCLIDCDFGLCWKNFGALKIGRLTVYGLVIDLPTFAVLGRPSRCGLLVGQ